MGKTGVRYADNDAAVVLSLCPVILSDYKLQFLLLKCTEVEILETIIRWGEHELMRRLEESEPSIMASTAHVRGKAIRRSDLNDEELKNILSNLLPLVRIDYILPPFHQVGWTGSIVCLDLQIDSICVNESGKWKKICNTFIVWTLDDVLVV